MARRNKVIRLTKKNISDIIRIRREGLKPTSGRAKQVCVVRDDALRKIPAGGEFDRATAMK